MISSLGINARPLNRPQLAPKASGMLQSITPSSSRPRPLILPSTLSINSRNSVKANAFNLQEIVLNALSGKPKPTQTPKIGFADVAGVDEAKLELQEVVDFLKNPGRYTDVGATIPRGVLLSGPPGTGKTLLAKAVAGESGVPFFSASGSEFVEMYVGMGASRVRKLFNEAKESAPCIVFIDEIDAMGKSRSGPGGVGGGSDEREQTLNQMLTEMDGFEGNTGVIVMAATNRSDVLDSALLRPGRFDRQVSVDVPDRNGREAILRVHSKDKPIADTIDFTKTAKRTAGFSGADLANIMNEAAISTARRGASTIEQSDIDSAIDTIISGPKKINGNLSEKKRELVAYHESGHAIVAQALQDYDAVENVSIEPRGNAAGLTWFTPDEDRIDSGLYTYKYLKDTIAVALGGRVAEELQFGDDHVTTGASNDLQRVTSVARQMVTQFGMSAVGPFSIDTNPMSGQISPRLNQEIEQAITKLVQEGYDTAKKILTDNNDLLQAVSQNLLEEDAISGDDFRALAQSFGLK